MQARDFFMTTPLDQLLEPGEAGDGFAAARNLLARVASDVPAYRQLLKEKGIDAAGIGSPGDFAKLPLLDKANYVRRFSQDEVEALLVSGAAYQLPHEVLDSQARSDTARGPRTANEGS